MDAEHVPTAPSTSRSWTFVTNHAQVLLAVARNPEASVTEIAETVQITERSTYRVLADLQRDGYVRRSKQGRQNRYEINRELQLLDPAVGNGLVDDLLRLDVEREFEGHLLLLPRRA